MRVFFEIAEVGSPIYYGCYRETHSIKDSMNDKTDTQRDIGGSIENVFKKEIVLNSTGPSTQSNRIYKRSERIAAVLYLLTRDIHDQEPLKSFVRERTQRLVTLSISIKDTLRHEFVPEREQFESVVRELVTSLRLLVVGGYVSQQNADITIEALSEVLTLLIQGIGSAAGERDMLMKTHFLPQETTVEGRIHSHVSIKKAQQKKDGVPQGRGGGNGAPHTSTLAGGAHTDRRELILAVLKKSGALGIKDIAGYMTDCSEKTVQRELAALVTQGQVLKSGEKRWSRYVLNSEVA